MKELKQYSYAVLCFVIAICIYACKAATTTCPTDIPTIGFEEAIERRDRCAVSYWANKEKNKPTVYFLHNITPRMLAAKTGDISILEAVLDTKWSNTDKDDAGMTPLHWAVLYNHKEAAKLLLDAGYEIDAEDNREFTPLSYAIKNKNIELVDFLIKNGANVNKTDTEGYTPLMLAAEWCYTASKKPSIIKLLLDAGAKSGKQDKAGRSALSLASKEFCHEDMQLLIAAGEDVNNHYTKGAIPLLVAAQYCDDITAEILIKAGADISVRTEDDETPLIVTGKYHCTIDEDTIRVYIGNGVDVLAEDINGVTIWDIVSQDPRMTDKATILLKQEINNASYNQIKNSKK